MLPLWYHPVFTDGIDPEARFPRERYRMTRQALHRRVGVPIRFEEAPPCAREDLLIAHDTTYVDAFLEGRLDARIERAIGLRPWTARIVERTRRIFGGSMAAARWVLDHGGRAGNLAGGTHHAFADRGAGYCVFNDVATAALLAVRRGARVLVVDLDVHQGDGTAAILAGVPDAFTLSVHCGKNFPFHKHTSDLDLPLPPGTTDAAYLDALRDVLPRAFDAARPDVVVYQAGVDPLGEDRLGKLALTRDGLRARNAAVLEAAGARPLVVMMGGGYGTPLEATAEAHADVFEQAARG